MAKSEIENHKSQIEAAKAALAPLAAIDPRGERRQANGPEGPVAEFSGIYHISRCNRTRKITTADIELAAKVLADEKATLADCLKAIRPLARLPDDFRVEDPHKAIYSFPGRDGGPTVVITNAIIDAAVRAMGEGD